MKISVSERLLATPSEPPRKGVMGAKSPVVPGKPAVFVDSSLRVKPARTTTSPGEDQNVVLITSDVLAVNLSTSAKGLSKRVSSSRTSILTVLLRRLILTLLISSVNGALYSTGGPSTGVPLSTGIGSPLTRATCSRVIVAPSSPAATRIVGDDTTRPRLLDSTKSRSKPNSLFGELRSKLKVPTVVDARVRRG